MKKMTKAEKKALMLALGSGLFIGLLVSLVAGFGYGAIVFIAHYWGSLIYSEM